MEKNESEQPVDLAINALGCTEIRRLREEGDVASLNKALRSLQDLTIAVMASSVELGYN